MLSQELKDVLDDRLWEAAETTILHFAKEGYKVSQFTHIDDKHKFKFHLIAKKRFETIAIDIREKCNTQSIENFMLTCHVDRVAAKVFFAVPELVDGNETSHTLVQKTKLRELGMGLLIVSDEKITIDLNTVGCHRKFALDPGTSLGKYKKDINELIDKYNLGGCLEAVRSLSEIAEDATYVLGAKAQKLGKLNISAVDLQGLEWDALSNLLNTSNYKSVVQTKIFNDSKFKNSLTNVRDKRNLSDHKKSAKEKRQMEEQFPEAMQQGIRVVRELIKITNNLK